MIRYVKYVFLIFGSLAAMLMTFFYLNNQKDISHFLEHKNELSFMELKQQCRENPDRCFFENYERYLKKSSLTGISIALKLGFNYFEAYKESLGKTTTTQNLDTTLDYIRMNNLAIKYSTKNFYGFAFTYGGYVGKVKEFLEKAQQFHQNMAQGFMGELGIKALESKDEQQRYVQKFNELQLQYDNNIFNAREYIDNEISILKAKHNIEEPQ